ncbi:MAG: hypothetical protein GX945_06675 [Lentisphaerae bacterium]|nr:hypothetical protein [Lentisphaerota bacterium]
MDIMDTMDDNTSSPAVHTAGYKPAQGASSMDDNTSLPAVHIVHTVHIVHSS